MANGVPSKDMTKSGVLSNAGGISWLCSTYSLKYLQNRDVMILEKARECEKEHGYVNTLLLKEHYNIGLASYHAFGGIKNMCAEYNIKYRMGLRYDPEKIKNSAIEYYKIHGRDMRQDKFEAATGYSSCAINSAFGSYNEMLKQANIPLHIHKKYTDEDVLTDVLKVISEYNSTSSTIYRKYGKYSQSIIDKTFGSWQSLIAALGLKKSRKRYGKERMLSDLTSLYNEHGFLSKTLIDENCPYTYEAVSFIFNGVQGICEAIGQKDAFNNSKSTGQQLLCNILDGIVGHENYIEEATFDWLIRPETKRHLRFDFYIPSLNLCIEYQGEQHYKYTTHFYRNISEFEEYQKRDAIKKELADANNMRVVYFTYKEKLTNDLVANRIFEV